jgi:hypothetical protein
MSNMAGLVCIASTFGVLAVSCVTPASAQNTVSHSATVASEADLLAEIAKQVPTRVPGSTAFILSGNILRVVSAKGAVTDKDMGFVKSACEASGKNEVDCVKEQVDWMDHALATPTINDLRIRFALYMGGTTWTAFQRGGSMLARHAFGPFQEECYKNGPDFIFPFIQWDGKNLGVTAEQIADDCEKATRDALGSLDAKATDLPADGIGVISGPFEASRTLFWDEWEFLARRLGGSLLVAIPNASTVLYARDGSGSDVLLSTRARKMIPAQRGYEDLSADVFRWSPGGWQLVSNHDLANRVVAGIHQAIPDAKVAIVEAQFLVIDQPQKPNMYYSLDRLAGVCSHDPHDCDEEVAKTIKDAINVLQSEPKG